MECIGMWFQRPDFPKNGLRSSQTSFSKAFSLPDQHLDPFYRPTTFTNPTSVYTPREKTPNICKLSTLVLHFLWVNETLYNPQFWPCHLVVSSLSYSPSPLKSVCVGPNSCCGAFDSLYNRFQTLTIDCKCFETFLMPASSKNWEKVSQNNFNTHIFPCFYYTFESRCWHCFFLPHLLFSTISAGPELFRPVLSLYF